MPDNTLIIGCITFLVLYFALLYFYFKSRSVSKSEFDNVNNSLQRVQPLLDAEKSKSESLEKRLTEKEDENKKHIKTITELAGELGSLKSDINGLNLTIENFKNDNIDYKNKNNILKNDYDKVFADFTRVSSILTTKTEELDVIKVKLKDKEDESNEKTKSILELSKELANEKAERKALTERLETLRVEMTDLHRYFKEQFTLQADVVLEAKSDTFKKTNKTELDTILNPLKEKINEFGEKINTDRNKQIADITDLKSQIQSLANLNQQLSEDANKLVTALKSDNKIQGNWGESRLKMIIENEGLQKHIDYTSQEVFKSDDYETNKQPDYIIKLPDNKSLIIDSKVSLKSYVEYFNSQSPDDKALHLKKHVESVKGHIDGLSNKEYQKINGINTTDYVLLFMPIENAYTLVLNENPEMFNYALNKKIIILTPSTLVATLKVVNLLWQKEERVENIEKVFKLCGSLYEKFIAFANDMLEIKKRIKEADNAYENAMYKLKDGKRRGDTIIGRIENINKLEGTTKNSKMPAAFLAEIELLETEEEAAIKLLEEETKTTN